MVLKTYSGYGINRLAWLNNRQTTKKFYFWWGIMITISAFRDMLGY